MKKFFKDFKEFALQGNVMDLAVGVIIGAAFQALVTSFTTNIISPIIGIITGGNFDSLQVQFLGVTLTYGAFITAVINFLITAFIVFLLVRGFNRLRRVGKHGAETPDTRECPYCFTSISAKASRCPDCTSEVTPLAPADNAWNRV